ncbi:hypothetical protein BN14_07870 [Rhizoctonia solani AG-1 IB]|uniref:Uncharacterized protein n=1 Tax=Thanatephorus cucumeris (strain AG1-IB / isolate 7/3/14) TaxID=1108050 RepID=M5C361_THACB|nr:hypothetical protein BN14_07870 [Rhizoctonia solani AG-1 IB]
MPAMSMASTPDGVYYLPAFTTYRNDIPILPGTGIIEANHIRNLYYLYANRHNDHCSPYSERHPDPLKRCIHAYPDIEVVTFEDEFPAQWYLGIDMAHALHGSYHHALQVFGNAVQPEGWNWHQPWAHYDYASKLAEIGFPYINWPINFTEVVYNFSFDTFHELQRIAHHNNFYAMCLNAMALIIDGAKCNHYTNLAHVGYIRGSPGLVSAHRFWCRMQGLPINDPSEDDLSDAGFPIEGYGDDTPAVELPMPPPEPTSFAQLDEFAERAFDYEEWGLEQPTSVDIDRIRLRDCTSEVPSTAPAGRSPELAELVRQLEQVALLRREAREAREPTGWGVDVAKPVWEWPGEPPNNKWIGSPVWPAPQTPEPWVRPDFEEDEGLVLDDTDMDFDIGGGIEISLNHLIQTRRAAAA